MCLISALYGSFFCEFEWRKCLQAYSSRRLDNLFWQENEGFLLWGYQSVTDICYNRKLIRFFFVSSTYQLAALTFHNVTRLGMSCWYYYGSWMITNALSFPLLFGLLCTVLLYNSDCLSVYLPIYLSIYPSLPPSIYLSSINRLYGPGEYKQSYRVPIYKYDFSCCICIILCSKCL